MRAERLTDAVAYHAEGPVWSEAWGGLRFVDMLAGDVLALRADATVERRHVGGIAAALRPRSRGGAVIGIERGFAIERPDGTVDALPEIWADAEVRMNEGACDPRGRFYCGSMRYDGGAGGGALDRLTADGSVDRVLSGVTISNGLDWSPDGSVAYYVDTATNRIDLFDDDAQDGLARRRPFVEVPSDDGHPDGLTVDAEGGIWVALHGGARVHRYTAEGALDAVVELPVRQVTACTFGGAALDELYVTTSRENLPPHEEPEAGSLFIARPGVRGMPTRAFAG